MIEDKEKSIIDYVVTPFQRFAHTEASGGIVLIGASILALIIANSPFSDAYHHLWELKFTIGFEGSSLTQSIHHWINDGLMAIFFFHVGLEIKREIREGELSTLRKASFPIVAAIGGMVVPALIYHFFNTNPDTASGWGIPMATDIAFSLGVLSLLGKRVPLVMKVFLTAFAIVDDLGAISVIAFFYTNSIDLFALLTGLVLICLLLMLNRINVKRTAIYIIIGIIVWYSFLISGVHATIAGVLVALTIPSGSKVDMLHFVTLIRHELTQLSESTLTSERMLSENQMDAVHDIDDAVELVQSPLQMLQENLHGFVAFIIMPLFAFANAGVDFRHIDFSNLELPSVITVALVVGKPLGILIFCGILFKLKVIALPKSLNWKHILGLGCLGGIGFTMSLFIANLALTDGDSINSAKLGIISASVLAGIAGYFILRSSTTVPLEDTDLSKKAH
jgi:NhaA family Na+:H+ antiporter